jgi:hypothetical protein
MVFEAPEAAIFSKFPVKLPVSWDNEQSRRPSALRRQPAVPVVKRPAGVIGDFAGNKENE